MQKINNIIIKAALAFLAAVMATGCIFEKENMPEDLQSVMIKINLRADGMTKADAELEPTAESAINSVRIYAYYNGNLSGHFYRASASTDPIVMDLRLPETGTHDVDFYVIANEAAMTMVSGSPSLTETTTASEIDAISFDGLTSADTNGLPMSYKATVAVNVDQVADENTLEGHQTHHYLLQTLNATLTRPLAKVAVYAAEIVEGSETASTTDSPKVTITNVEITNLISSGYLTVPVTYPTDLTSDFVSSTDIPVVNTVGSAENDATSNVANYTEIVAPHYFYENAVGGTTWAAAHILADTDLDAVAEGAMLIKIDYSFDGGSTSIPAYVKMPEIKRNHYYQVLCRFSPVGGTHEFIITINEWNYISHVYDEVTIG